MIVEILEDIKYWVLSLESATRKYAIIVAIACPLEMETGPFRAALDSLR